MKEIIRMIYYKYKKVMILIQAFNQLVPLNHDDDDEVGHSLRPLIAKTSMSDFFINTLYII